MITGKPFKHFSIDEIKDSKDGSLVLTPELIQFGHMMDEMREFHYRRKKSGMKVNSWYRTAEHNKAVGGDENSCHVDGIAVDISFPGLTKAEGMIYADAWYCICQRYGVIGGVGLYYSKQFIHFDANNDPNRYGGNNPKFRLQHFW